MADPVEILVLDHSPILGGAERFALRLAESAGEVGGYRVVLVCPPGSALDGRAASAGVPVRHARFPKPGPASIARMPAATLRIRRLLRTAGPGAVAVGNSASAQAYLAAAAATLPGGPRVVHLLHERDTAARRSAQLVLPRSGSLVAVGERVAAAYRERVAGADPATINIFLTPAELDAAGRVAPRPAAGGAGLPTIGVVGRMIPEKGLVELVEELASVRASWERLLVAAGPQDLGYERTLRARIEALGLAGAVELLGWVEDLDGFFSRIDVLVVPSTGTEGQVFGVLEALARGRPSVVRDTVLSEEYEGLPVAGYAGASELGLRLSELPSAAVDRELLARRFGPRQAIDGILAAAGAQAGASARS